MPVISDLALYEVTVRPPYRPEHRAGMDVSAARVPRVVGAGRAHRRSDRAPRPVARAQRRGDRMNPTKRGQQLAASAERWADTAESRAQIAYTEGAGPVLNTALAALVSVAYAAASLAWTWTDDA